MPEDVSISQGTLKLSRSIYSIITDRVRSTRGGNIFSLSVCPHPGGGGTYLPDGGGTYSGLDGGEGGTYSQVWMGGGGTYSQVWMVGGYLLSSLDGGGVPTFPGLDGGGTYLPRWGGYLGRYPPPPPEQYSVDWLHRSRYASCVLAQEDFLVLKTFKGSSNHDSKNCLFATIGYVFIHTIHGSIHYCWVVKV